MLEGFLKIELHNPNLAASSLIQSCKCFEALAADG